MDPDTEHLDDILKRLLAANLEIRAAVIVSTEGLPIASAIPRGTDEARIAAMTSALFSLGRMSIIEAGKGNFDQVQIKGSDGYLLVAPVGSYAIMLLSTTGGFDKFDFNIFSHPPFKPPGSSSAAIVEKDL
jgi:predicted regulator of Ras-like GTPase activity (Roadblock/LC7/MglB family)